MAERNFIPIGKITGVHGLRGNVKVYSYAESLETFEPGLEICIRQKGRAEERVTVRRAGAHKKGILLSFNEVQTIDEAEKLVGGELLIARSNLPELEEGTYYWFEIIGLKVYTVSGEYLGVVKSIFPTGSNDVYVVKDGSKETLIPALKSVLVSVSPQEGLMKVELPEGL